MPPTYGQHKRKNTNESLRLLNTKELAEVLGVSERTIRAFVLERRIPYIKVGRCVRFKLDDVMRTFETFEPLENVQA